jgi:hypothetical protein
MIRLGPALEQRGLPMRRSLITSTLVSLVALCMLINIAKQADATPISFNYSGIWRDRILANSPIQPGDAFTGRFFYDPDTAVVTFHRDGLVSGEVTDYLFSRGGAGIDLRVATAKRDAPPRSGRMFRFRGDASAMGAEAMNNFSDGNAPPIDRFYLQSFPSARFPNLYERNLERLSIDIVDSNLMLVDSAALPMNLDLPLNGYAVVFIQGGPSLLHFDNLDYDAGGNLQSLTATPEPNTLVLVSTGLVGMLSFSWWRRRDARPDGWRRRRLRARFLRWGF